MIRYQIVKYTKEKYPLKKMCEPKKKKEKKLNQHNTEKNSIQQCPLFIIFWATEQKLYTFASI